MSVSSTAACSVFLVWLALLRPVLLVESTLLDTRVDYDQPNHMVDKAEVSALIEVLDALLNDTQWRKQQRHPRPCGSDPWPGIECLQLDDYQLHVIKIDIGVKSTCKSNANISPSIYKLPHLRALTFTSCFMAPNTTLPSGLEVLAPSLQSLTLRKNPGFSSTIPKQLGRLHNLEVLSLSQNNFQGRIPAELANLSKLRSLDLSYNSLSGSVPAELGQATALSILDLSNNLLEGPIPDSIGQLMQLKKIDMSNNHLSGRIPASIGSLKQLQFLAVNRNRLTGGLPNQMGALIALEYALLQDNPMQTSIPDVWTNLRRITELRLSNSSYSGPIPASISNLRNLTELAMDRNLLTGTIPANLGNLPGIYHLNLSYNLLTGSIPFSTGFMSRLGGNLDLHGNAGLCAAKKITGPGTVDIKRCSRSSSSSPMFSPWSSVLFLYLALV